MTGGAKGPRVPYEPIDCRVHDQLLERATWRRPTTIVHRTGGGEEHVLRGIIEDVFTRKGAEFLLIVDGEQERLEIRLDRIIRFGDGLNFAEAAESPSDRPF